MMHDKMTLTIAGRDVRLYTTVYPKDHAETVILLHGGPGVPDDLTDVAEHLCSGYQVISFHQRGTKNSPVSAPDYSLESYMADLDSIADHFDLHQFHLFGHSWGGLYAQIYAQQHPGKIISLFLASPSSGTGIQWSEMEKEVMSFNTSNLSMAEWLSLGWNSFLGMLGSDTAYQKVFTQVLLNYNRGFNTVGSGSIDVGNVKADPVNKTRMHLKKYPVLSVMPNPDFKISITYGEKDIYGPSKKYVRTRYPTAHFFTIENCGHLPMAHNRNKFTALLNLHLTAQATAFPGTMPG